MVFWQNLSGLSLKMWSSHLYFRKQKLLAYKTWNFFASGNLFKTIILILCMCVWPLQSPGFGGPSYCICVFLNNWRWISAKLIKKGSFQCFCNESWISFSILNKNKPWNKVFKLELLNSCISKWFFVKYKTWKIHNNECRCRKIKLKQPVYFSETAYFCIFPYVCI